MAQFLDLKAQHEPILDQIKSEINAVMDQSAFIGGEYVSRFEQEFAGYLNAPYCLGVANGSDALEIAIETLGLPKGSEIIVPANTFIATAEAVLRTGHRVVFCDYDHDDYLIDINSLEACITDRTKAIIPVHLYGQPADMPKIMAIARERNLKVIEDAAQAHGAEIGGKKAGAIGDIGCFSFYPGKNLGAFGDGGAIICKDEEIYLRAKMIANHGRLEKYDHQMVGRNSRLDSLQAAVLSVKLRYLDQWNSKRNEIAQIYHQKLSNSINIVLPLVRENSSHVFHLYVIRTKNRDSLIREFKRADVGFGIHYPSELPDLPPFINNEQVRSMRIRTSLSNEILSLPMGPAMTSSDIDLVIEICRRH